MPQRASSPGDPFTASDWEEGPRSSSVEPLDQADLIASDEEVGPGVSQAGGFRDVPESQERPIYELDRSDIANAQYTFRFRRPTSADADNSLYLTGRDVSPPRTDAIGASDSDDQLPEPLHQPPSKSLFDILDWSKNVVDSETKPTPYRHSTSSSLSQDHSRDSVYNILRDVLRTQARELATESWLHGVMELDRETHATLAEQIAEADWENKPEIRAALQKIQAATKETDTYDPFCQVLNYILEHASALPFVQGNPGSTDRITGLRFLPHFRKMIKRGSETDVRAAGRFPDVVGMTRTVEETQWHMLPVTCELKFHNKDACNERGVPRPIPSSASSLVDDFAYENPLDLESASTAASTSIQTSPIQTPPSANVAALAPIGACSSPSATAAASPSVGTLPPAHVAAPPSVETPPAATVTALPTIGTRSSFAATVAESLPAGAPSPPPITPVFAAPAVGASPILNSPAVSNVLPSTSNDLVRATSPAKPSTKRPRAHHTTEGERARKRLNIYGRTAPLVNDDRIAAYQATSNALETLRYSHGARFSCISITYVDDRFAFWYYDPCGIVKSDKKLSFFEDFARTAAVFVALGRMSSRRWGQLPAFTPPAGTSFPYANLTGFTVELRDPSTPEGRPLTATLGRPIHTLYEVVGRRSFVYEAELARPGEAAGTHVSMVAKVAFQASTRVEEHTLIQHARERSVPHIPEIHAHRDLYEIMTFADSVWQRLQHLESIDNPFGDIEKRVARVIVFTRYIPLKERLLQYPEDLVRMVDQIKEALHALRHNACILHRDVSYNNIMWTMGPDNGAHFVLIDFDLAIVVDENGKAKGPTARHRTGTLPFMAIELLEAGSKLEVSHQLYHDYESLFWVSLWAAMKTETVLDPSLNGKIREAVREWETGEPATIADRKEHILSLKTLDKVPLTPRFKKLYPFLYYFALVFANAMFQANQLRASRMFRSTERYRNEKRSGGRAVEAHDAWTDAITRDSIKAVITEYYASLEESTEGDDAQESGRAGGGVGMGEGALSAQ